MPTDTRKTKGWISMPRSGVTGQKATGQAPGVREKAATNISPGSFQPGVADQGRSKTLVAAFAFSHYANANCTVAEVYASDAENNSLLLLLEEIPG